jgi:hypothetical protein
MLTYIKHRGVFFSDDNAFVFAADPKDAMFMQLYQSAIPDVVVSDDAHFQVIATGVLQNLSQFIKRVGNI